MGITEKDIEKIVDKVIGKLEDKSKRDYYKETEAALRAYKGWKISIERNKERISEIKENGFEEMRKGGINERVAGGILEYKSNLEKEIEKIKHLEEEILNLEKRVIRVDNALIHIEEEPFKEIIELRYFNNLTIEEIATELNTNEKRITRRRNKLVNKIANALYPEFIFR